MCVFDNAEIIAKFEKEIDLITNKNKTMGIKELVLERAKNEGIKIGIEKKGTKTSWSL